MRSARIRRAWPASYRGRIAVMIALALLIVLGAQAVIRGVIDDRIRSSAAQTLQEQAQRIADDVDAVPDAAKSNRASDAARYLPGTRIEVFWPEPGSLLYYNLVRSEGLNISASARSGDVQVKLRGGTRIGGLSDWLVVAIFVVGLAVAAALVWGLASAVAQRLRQQAAELAASAQAVASGDLTVRAEVSDDELGRAAGAFNQMTERLAEADRRQRRFLADVAHELRTPVTAIDGFATALVDGAAASPEARAEAVAFIREEAVRLRELIGDLRELTRLDLDPAPDLSSFDLVELARDSVARFSQAAMDAGIELGAPDGTAVAITADKADVETILANLIQNALTATPAGGHVQVEVAREATSVVLRVSDTGVGIAPEHVPRIFDRLYRIDSARARDRGGSGLGLAIVKRLAESLGGSVSVDSSPGTGSTFTVRWPAEPPTHAPAGVSAGRGVTHP